MMIPKEEKKHTQTRRKEENREERIIKKKGGKLLRQLEKGKAEHGGAWSIDHPGCVHLTPGDKT